MDKPKRSPNFSTAELTAITKEVEKRKDKLFQKFNSTVSNAIKKRLSEEITSKVNEVNKVNRTVTEILKKMVKLATTFVNFKLESHTD